MPPPSLELLQLFAVQVPAEMSRCIGPAPAVQWLGVEQQTIQIEGVPLHVIDTAGLRESSDEVERIGIARVSLPATLMLAAIQGMRDALAALRANGYAGGPGARLADFREQLELVGFKEVFALEQRYLAGLQHPGTAR